MSGILTLIAVAKAKRGGGVSGFTADDIAAKSASGDIVLNATSLGAGFSGYKQITSVTAPNATSVSAAAFDGCSSLRIVCFPKLTQIIQNQTFYGCNRLIAADFAVISKIAGWKTFVSSSQLVTLILRRSTGCVTLGGSDTLNGTPFASGGSGGTIYIPKALYDHLDDGTSLDYKAATNWSTYDAYGTITWAKIEGSIYETQYADGTPIPTA